MSDDAAEKKPSKPHGWRKAWIVSLVVLYGLLAVFSFVIMPADAKVVERMAAHASRLVDGAINLAVVFHAQWWVFAAVFGGLGLLGWIGALDKILKPLVFLAVLLLIGIGGLCGYVHTLPAQWEKRGVEQLEKRFIR